VIEKARRYIEDHTDVRPTIGVVLGSGLGAFAGELENRVDLPYSELPGWPGSTAIGHAGRLILGKVGDLDVAVMAGRVHLYEGYSPAQVTYGVRVLGAMGVRSMVFTNRATARQVAEELGIAMTEGVYAAVLGPSYETPAEIRFLRTIGADVVGMSTVPEVIVANHMGMKVLGLSCVTNMAAGILPQKIDHLEVLETGDMVRDLLVRFLKALLPRLEA
jgi:purine-nucleoside phosphorylase